MSAPVNSDQITTRLDDAPQTIGDVGQGGLVPVVADLGEQDEVETPSGQASGIAPTQISTCVSGSSRRAACAMALVDASLATTNSATPARRSVNAPTEQPGSKQRLDITQPVPSLRGSDAIVIEYLRCSYGLVPNFHGSADAAYRSSKVSGSTLIGVKPPSGNCLRSIATVAAKLSSERLVVGVRSHHDQALEASGDEGFQGQDGVTPPVATCTTMAEIDQWRVEKWSVDERAARHRLHLGEVPSRQTSPSLRRRTAALFCYPSPSLSSSRSVDSRS
jgi:hypothetical protein